MISYKQDKQLYTIAYLIIFLVTIVFCYFNSNHKDFWFDEGFSLHLAKASFTQIWVVTADDVHPPLYYWMLKIFLNIFGHSVVTARIFSAIPILLIVIVGYTHVRKIWNDKIALFFMLIVVLHPMMHYPISEIRMYSWAMFFCLMTYIYAYRLYTNPQYKDAILLSFFALCCGYTHYYALITAFAILGWLFIMLCISKRDKLYLFGIVALSCILGYAPWLGALYNQVNTVTDDYWITKLANLNDILYYISPFVKLKFVGILFLITTISFVIYSIREHKERRKTANEALILMLVSAIPIIIGIIYSVCVRPVFIVRYVYPSLPLFFLSFAMLFSIMDLKNRIIKITLILFLGVVIYESIRTTKKDTQRHREVEERNNLFDTFINESADNTYIFLHHYTAHAEMPYWTYKYPNNKHIAKTAKIVPRNQVVEYVPHEQISTFLNLTDQHKTIFYDCDNQYSFATNEKDSIELMKNYSIADQIDHSGHTLYKLQRKIN